VTPEALVYDAVLIMAEKSIGALPVIADGQVVGMVTERDYARKVALQSRSSKDTRVSEIMTTPVISVTADETVEECLMTMTLRRIRHLPVVERGQVVGIVSIGDLVRQVVLTQSEIIQQLQNYITGQSFVQPAP
jgi:CBS domain-containing protein